MFYGFTERIKGVSGEEEQPPMPLGLSGITASASRVLIDGNLAD